MAANSARKALKRTPIELPCMATDCIVIKNCIDEAPCILENMVLNISKLDFLILHVQDLDIACMKPFLQVQSQIYDLI